MNALEVRELTKVYPEFTLDKVSFFVKQGHISGLIGRNGAGKSTTIKGSKGIFPDLLEETEQGKARQLKVFYVLSMRKEVSLSLGKIFLKRKWLLNRR